jgi:Protein of unknown function (DUF2442)
MPKPELKHSSLRTVYVVCDEKNLSVRLADGRQLSLPLDWYPRLKHGTPAERNNWRLIGGGEGIHWPDLDEDLSVESLVAGRKSMESAASFRFWLDNKKQGKLVTLDDFMKHSRKTRGQRKAG